jgi:hypothetical protein
VLVDGVPAAEALVDVDGIVAAAEAVGLTDCEVVVLSDATGVALTGSVVVVLIGDAAAGAGSETVLVTVTRSALLAGREQADVVDAASATIAPTTAQIRRFRTPPAFPIWPGRDRHRAASVLIAVPAATLAADCGNPAQLLLRPGGGRSPSG